MFVFLQETDENTDTTARLGTGAGCRFYPLPIKEMVIMTECWIFCMLVTCIFSSIQFKVFFIVVFTVRKHVSLSNDILPLPSTVNASRVKYIDDNTKISDLQNNISKLQSKEI